MEKHFQETMRSNEMDEVNVEPLKQIYMAPMLTLLAGASINGAGKGLFEDSTGVATAS